MHKHKIFWLERNGRLHTGFGWGRKLLTREMLHMPSKYCWAWMVTELMAPVRGLPPMVTCTLGFSVPALGDGLWDQPSSRCRSPTGRTLCAGWGILDLVGLEDRLTTLWVISLVGCPGKVLGGRDGMLETGYSSWRVWIACCFSCCAGVPHTWHLVPSCPPFSGQSGTCSWSMIKEANPGSYREQKRRKELLQQ